MLLPVKELSAEDNIMLLNFKIKALKPPREPVRLLDVDESVQIQVQEVKTALVEVQKKVG